MSNSGQEREDELAELLREVRALRATIDQLQAGTAIRPMLPPDYAVLARTGAELSPNYEVLVRSQPTFLPPDYAVLVRSQPTFLPPDYAVLVRSQPTSFPPDYEVLVRPAFPEGEESSASDE